MGNLHGIATATAALLISATSLWVISVGPVAASTRSPNAVVAIVDSGINPYHESFADDSRLARQHPSTYIPGYPKDAIALRLTLDEKDYWAAVHADCKRVWSKIKRGKLYWIPGTKIVGAITFDFPDPLDCDGDKPFFGGRILDPDGHGTMTASRATSDEYGACEECRVVSVQFPMYVSLTGADSDKPARDAIKWAAKNASWIDAQSNSWGPIYPAWEPTGVADGWTSNPRFVRAVDDASRAHLSFWASGNGILHRYGALGHPTMLSPHFVPSAIVVGGHDSGFMTAWSGFPPHVVADACNAWAAEVYETKKSRASAGYTSGATPFAAGGAVRVLLEARRLLHDDQTGVDDKVVARGRKGLVSKGPLADGVFTLKEWRNVVFKTASPRPKRQFQDGTRCGRGQYGSAPVKWADVPEGYPEYLHIGYGAVDAESYALAVRVLRGLTPLPDRSATERYFELDHTARSVLHDVYDGL